MVLNIVARNRERLSNVDHIRKIVEDFWDGREAG
jgi:hypothetical protein